MILVDIYVPSTDQEYDFQLDQNATISAVIDELVELISQKERCTLMGPVTRLSLCSREQQKILPNDCTLAECNIRTGSQLILV